MTVIKVIIIFDQYFLSVVYVSAMYVYVLSHVQLFVFQDVSAIDSSEQ